MRLIDADALKTKFIGFTTESGIHCDIDRYALKMIDEQPTVEPQLDEWCDDCKEYDQERHCCPRFNHVIRTTIDDVRKEAMAQRWIPVTERLPKEWEYVLCCYEYFRYGDYNCMFRTIDRGYYGNGRWGGEAGQGHKNKVLAWMPLPEPYKGDGIT